MSTRTMRTWSPKPSRGFTRCWDKSDEEKTFLLSLVSELFDAGRHDDVAHSTFHFKKVQVTTAIGKTLDIKRFSFLHKNEGSQNV